MLDLLHGTVFHTISNKSVTLVFSSAASKLNHFVDDTSLVLVSDPGRSVNSAIEMTVLLLLNPRPHGRRGGRHQQTAVTHRSADRQPITVMTWQLAKLLLRRRCCEMLTISRVCFIAAAITQPRHNQYPVAEEQG